MIFQFLALCIIGGCGLIIGNPLLAALDPEGCFKRVGDRFLLSIWIGVLFLLNLLLGVSLFFPLSPLVVLSILISALFISLCFKQNRSFIFRLSRFPLSYLFVVFVPLGCVSIASTHIIHWYDSGLYHIQAVKWLSEYGLVPGLALIHSRFGFISSWLTLAASFNHGLFEGRVFALPGSICMWMLLLGWSISGFRILQRHARGEDWFLLSATTIAVPLIVLRWLAPSPSPDLPVMALILFVGWAVFSLSGTRSRIPRMPERIVDADIIPLLLSTGAVTIKLSAVPLVAVTLVYYVFSRPSRLRFKRLITAAVVVPAVLLPLAAGGIVASGCALYPASYFCADLPWSLGKIQALTEAKIIREWARWNGPTPEGAAPLDWVLPWFGFDKVFSLLIVLTFIAAAVVLILSARKFRGRDYYLISVAILGIFFMFFNAPTWRFGLGYVFIVPALAAAILQERWGFDLKRSYGSIKYLATFSLLGMVGLYMVPNYVILRYSQRQIGKAGRYAKMESRILLPPVTWKMEYDQDKTTGEILTSPVILVQERTADVTYYRSSDGEMCWDAPLPCAPEKLKNIRLRDPRRGIAAGFMRTVQQEEMTDE